MKPFFYTLFSFFLTASLSLSAQITLSVNDMIPAIGEQYSVKYYSAASVNFSPGPAGANQNWDFSQIDQGLLADYNFSIIAPADGVGNQEFPDADFVWLLNEFDAYNYYKINGDNIELIGGTFGSDGIVDYKEVYTDTEDALRFPLTFNTSYSYSSAYQAEIFGISTPGFRNGTVEIDGYGSITTPLATYSNVLRMKIVSTDHLNFTETQYAWILAGQFIPVAVYSTTNDPDTPADIYFSQLDGGTSTAEPLKQTDFGVRIAGNIVRDQLQLTGIENIPSTNPSYYCIS